VDLTPSPQPGAPLDADPDAELAQPFEPSLDLSPRTTTDLSAPPPSATRRRIGWTVVLAALLGIAAFVVFQFLSSATLYFCNADEVGVTANCQEGRRFRLQGVVEQGSIETTSGALSFAVTYGGATYPVTYQGDPGGIFDEGIPVVVEGRLVDGTFEGDRILVKHTEQYREENPDRVPEGAP
jgi:cytochrome c-type biogenesis protein CcmE